MAFIDPYEKDQPVETAGPSGFVDPYDTEDEKKTLEKGSLKDQVHDIASGATAAADLVTMLPGMVGGAIGTGIGMAVHGSKQPAQDFLTGIGEGGERSSASNLLGITENDPGYRDRPGYRAVMRPVEAVTEAMHWSGQQVEKGAKKGLFGSDRTNPAVARELGAGTELAALAGLPFLRGRGAKPGSPRAYQEGIEARPRQSMESFEQNRNTYGPEPEYKPFDMKDFKEPAPESYGGHPSEPDPGIPYEPVRPPYNELKEEGVPPRMEAFEKPFPEAPTAPEGLGLEPFNLSATDPVRGKRDQPTYGFDPMWQRDRSNEGQYGDVQPLTPDIQQRGPEQSKHIEPPTVEYKPHLRGPAADMVRDEAPPVDMATKTPHEDLIERLSSPLAAHESGLNVKWLQNLPKTVELFREIPELRDALIEQMRYYFEQEKAHKAGPDAFSEFTWKTVEDRHEAMGASWGFVRTPMETVFNKWVEQNRDNGKLKAAIKELMDTPDAKLKEISPELVMFKETYLTPEWGWDGKQKEGVTYKQAFEAVSSMGHTLAAAILESKPHKIEKGGPKNARFTDKSSMLELWNDRLAGVLARTVDETKPGTNKVRMGLMEIQRNSTSPYYRQLAKKLLEDPDFKPDFELAPHGMRNIQGLRIAGQYVPARHKIFIEGPVRGSEQLLLHEAIHARVYAAIQAYLNQLKSGGTLRVFDKKMSHVRAPVERLLKLYESLQSDIINYSKGGGFYGVSLDHPLMQLTNKYGLYDIHEFITEGLTNPAFQADLAQIKLPKELQKGGFRFYWDSFVDSIRSMLGLDSRANTYLSELIRASSDLMSGLGKTERLHYADMLDGAKDLGLPLKELKRKGAVQALAEEAREMSLEGMHNTPIEKVVERIQASGKKIEDWTADHTNRVWKVLSRVGSLVKENLLMDTSIRQLMKDKPGTGPFVKWTIDSVAHIERKMTKDVKAAVQNGLADFRRMFHNRQARHDLNEMWDKWQENIGVRDLTRADFRTERQWNVYSKMRAEDEKLLERVNEKRIEAGLTPIDRIPSHFRGMWEGDYRVFVYDGAGNKKAAYGFDTEWAAQKVADGLRKKHPDMKVTDAEHVKTDQYGIRNLQGFEDAIKIMSEKNDPVARALQSTYHEILKHRGFGRTGVQRKGVAGFMGSEGGILGLRKMESAFEQHINQGYRYVANLEKQQVLAELQKVPKEMRDKLPETFDFLQSYIRKTQGAKMGDYNPLDAFFIRLSKATGFGEHGPQKILREASAITFMYWLTTPRFLISQSVQSLNAIPKLVQKYGQIDAAKAYFTGVKHAFSPDAVAKEATSWAAERGYLDATIRNLVGKDIQERPTSSWLEAAKEVSSIPAAKIEHNLVRLPVFLAFESALRPYIKDKVARFEEAAGYADYYMVNYGRTHSPMVYDKLGTILGESTRPLKQYAHNTWGQFFEYARGAKNKGEVAPLAYFLGVQASVAGLKGMMLAAEVTAIVTLLNYTFDLDIPTPEQLMLGWAKKGKEAGVPGGLMDAMIYGGLSTALGTDVSSSVSAPGIPNMFTAAPLQFNYRVMTDMTNFLWKLAKGEDTDQDRLRAAMAITPNLFHEYLKSLYTKPGQPTANPNDKNLRGNYRRTEMEDDLAKFLFAAKPLNEAKADAMMRAVKQELQRDMVQRQNAVDAIVDRIENNQEVDPSLFDKYIEQGGNPANLNTMIRNKIKERMMTGPERMQDSQRLTPQKAHELEVLQQYLDEIYDQIPLENRKFDPNTGEFPSPSAGVYPRGLDGATVLNDTMPPHSWHTKLPQIDSNADKNMKTTPHYRAQSEYIIPHRDAGEFLKEKLLKKNKNRKTRM